MTVARARRQQRGPRSRRTGLLAAGLAAIAFGIAGCAADSDSSLATSLPTPTAAASASGGSPTASVQPGRPYSASDVLTAMRDSRRPGGVAAELQTEAIAAGVAEELWTWNGEAWQAMTATGSCGPASCTLEIIGSTDGMAGADTYTFEVVPADDAVDLVATDLHGYPPDLESAFDQIARAAVPVPDLEGMVLLGARWLPPPDAGSYWLSYRSGGEEGSPSLDVMIDFGRGVVVETRPPT